MNEDELKTIIEKYGYKLEKVIRFKRHDRIRVTTNELIITINLRKHLDETPCDSLLKCILSNEELEKEGIKVEGS